MNGLSEHHIQETHTYYIEETHIGKTCFLNCRCALLKKKIADALTCELLDYTQMQLMQVLLIKGYN